jgi:hypothetical protein
MTRRTLSTQGRFVVAGLSIAVGAGLAGFMAASDHTANASPPSGDGRQNNDNWNNDDLGSERVTPGARAPSDDRDVPYYTPRPQTRTAGS